MGVPVLDAFEGEPVTEGDRPRVIELVALGVVVSPEVQVPEGERPRVADELGVIVGLGEIK